MPIFVFYIYTIIVPDMLSVIIPTLNAAEELPHTLAALVPGVIEGVVKDVIISDGGSNDETEKLADASGAYFTSGKKGRGLQLGRGAAAARGNWLLFLHADTRLAPGWEHEVQRFIAQQMSSGKSPAAAYFRFALDDRRFFARIMEFGVRVRSSWLALPYGDQGLLIEARHFKELGGYADWPLMEDVDLVRRIGRRRLKGLNTAAITGAARYKQGFLRRIMRNLTCLALYFARVPPARIARFYQ